jgi:hypothetical protein
MGGASHFFEKSLDFYPTSNAIREQKDWVQKHGLIPESTIGIMTSTNSRTSPLIGEKT